MSHVELTRPVLPGVPPGYRWVVEKNKLGWHWVYLQQHTGKKWKNIAGDKAVHSSWGDSYKPTAEQLPDRICETAEGLWSKHTEDQKLKAVSEHWVGIYESRKI